MSDSWYQPFLDFYENHTELAVALAGLLGGLLLAKVLPTALRLLGTLATLTRSKLGGRIAYKSMQGLYLNWAVLESQDLNLTGIIGGEKPRLEQIFVSLNVSKSRTDSISDIPAVVGKKESRNKWTSIVLLFGPFGFRIVGALMGRGRIRLGRFREQSSTFSLFQATRLWRLPLLWRRFRGGGIFVILTGISLVAVIANGLFIASDINNPFAGVGMFLLVAISGLWLILIKSEFDDRSLDVGSAIILGSLLILSVGALTYAIVSSIVLNDQSPLAVSFGGGLMTAIWVSVGISGLTNRHPQDERVAPEIGDLLFSHDYVAVLGGPGSGKSTMLQFITLTFAQQKSVTGEPSAVVRNRVSEAREVRKY